MKRLLSLALVLLAACGGSGDTASKSDSEPSPVEQTAATSPAQPNLTSKEVVAAFVQAGLEAEAPASMTVDDFGLAPKKTDDATRFLIPSLGADSGGRAFVFEDVADLRDTKAYYDEIGEESAALFSWTFANEDAGVLVQINGELAEDEARRYEEVVAGL